MDKVLLVNVIDLEKTRHPVDYWPNISLEIMKAGLEDARFSCDFLDTRFEEIGSIVVYPDFVIIDFHASDLAPALKICNKLKSDGKNITIIATGPRSTLFPESVLFDDSPVDYVLGGEVERIMPEFLAELKNDKPDFSKFDCLATKEKTHLHIRLEEEMDKLPVPIFSYDYYSIYPIKGIVRPKHGFILSSRGCCFNCTFCNPMCRFSFGKKFRSYSIEKIIAIVKSKLDNGCNLITFMDDDFVQDRMRVVELCNRIISEKLKFKWIAHARIDELDEELLVLMKKAGCSVLKLGLESASFDVLNTIKKTNQPETWVEKIKTLVNKAEDIGIIMVAMFILGSPGETAEDLSATKKIISKIHPTFLQLARYTDYTSDPFLVHAKKRKHHYIYNHQLKKFEREIYLGFYLRPSVILKHIRLLAFYLFNLRYYIRTIRFFLFS